MYRLIGFVIALMVAMFPGNLAAQARGGHVGGFVGRSGLGASSFRGSGTFIHTAPFRSFARPVVIAPFGYYPGFYSPFYSPYYSSYYPYDWGSSYAPASTYSTPSYAAPSYIPAPAPDSSVDLAYQVGQLSQQIAELRREQSAPAAGLQAGSSSLSGQTVLVFRDGHVLQIQNYAIVGQTLWVFDEHTSNRISLTDLDLTATQNENKQRGVRFSVPE